MENAQAKAPAKFQRRTILIKKHLQYRYMSLIFFSVLLAFIVVGLDVLWTVSKVVNEHPMMQPLLDEMAQMVPLFALKIVMYMVMVLIVSAVISHRMAGPIFKFEKSCSTVADGDLTHRVYLREGDQLTELQDHFNNMTGAVNEVVREYEKFRGEAAAGGMAEKAAELGRKVSEIMPKFKI
ncbi:MAG: HAMP domain-containing protein [Elusimicrobia bacterium]|nr:HAMP domain-containing protein [Elusimicrobiota bacterium]